MERRKIIFLAAVLLGLTLRLWLTATTVGSSDVIYKTTWAHLAEHYGTAKAYAHSPYMNDPPLAVAASVLLDRLGEREELAFADLFRVAQTFADLVSLACLILLARRVGLPPETALFYFLSPTAIMISGFHCNSDPAMVACVLVALVLFAHERHAESGVALAVATGVKVVPLLLLPLFLMAAGRKAWRFGAGWLAAMAVLFGIPAAIGGSAVLRNTFLYKSVGNWWGLVSLFHFAGLNRVERLFRAGNTIVIFLMVLAVVGSFRRRDLIHLIAACGVVFTFLLVFGAGFGVQYLLWPIAFLPFFTVRLRWVVSATSAIFLFAVYTHWSGGFPWWFANSDAPNATTDALVMLGWVAWASLAAAGVNGFRMMSVRRNE